MNRAPVAVVIVSWNSAGYLPDCLDSLRRLTRRPAEIVVVDAASADDSVALVEREFPEVCCLPQRENVGFCVGNNLGFAATNSPFVLALNPDTKLEPDFLERLLPSFDDPSVGLAGGKLLRFDRKTLDSAGQELGRSRQPIDRGYGRPDDGRFDCDAEVFGVCGAAALYRRRMLESVRDGRDGFFDPAFFAFFEDLDLAWRARKLGWKAVYRHEAVGYHARGGSAERRHPLQRWASMLRRRPEVQYHIAKNRYLSILRNDSVAGYLAHAPWIWSRDLAVLALLCRRPSLLLRLWRSRRLFGEALRLRRLDALRVRHQFESERVG